MLFAVIFIIGILCGIGAWFFEKRSKNFEITGSMILAIICVLALFVGGIGSVNVLMKYSSHNAHCYEIRALRRVLIEDLHEYDEMRETNVNALPFYLALQEKVIDFNKNVIYAKEHNNIWLNYFCSDFAYAMVEVIPLEVD